MTLIFRLAGKTRRTPREYRATDRLTFRARQRLINTNECVHASVRIRMGLCGYGYNDHGYYDSQGLVGWTMEYTELCSSSSPPSSAPVRTKGVKRGDLGSMTDVKWVKKDPQGRNDPEMVMPEDELGELEQEIMNLWPDVVEGFSTIKPSAHSLRMFKSPTDPLAPSPRHSNSPRRLDSGKGLCSVRSEVSEVDEAKRSPRIQTL